MKNLSAIAAIFFPSVALASTGFVIDTQTGPRTDAIVMENVIYTGACPGSSLLPVRGYFFDTEMPTVEGRRVKIANITQGISSNPFPYTDRQYSSGGRSEKIDFFARSHHGQRYFSVIEGMNEFEVTYSDGGRVVATKSFQFPVSVTTRYEGRWPVCRVDNRCTATPNGTVCSPQTVCECL